MNTKLSKQIENLSFAEQECLVMVLDELAYAKEKHPAWPADIIHAAAILSEEAGEVVKECNNVSENGRLGYDDCVTEAAQTGAMALRFLANTVEGVREGALN
jgi:hypothetical protein